MISSLEFGAFLAYSPGGHSSESVKSRQVRDLIKLDRSIGTPPRNVIAYTVERLRAEPSAAALRDLLSPNVVLVPCPGSAPLPPPQVARGPALWTPRQICRALLAAGLGSAILECLQRETPIRKSAFAGRGARPTPREHYESIGTVGMALVAAPRIVVVDDFVTKGATLLGAASRVAELYPEARVSGFALVRTMGLIPEIDRIVDPVVGRISLLQDGEADRQP